MDSIQLFFGSAIPGGGHVSKQQWTHFLDTTITPLFPTGLTVYDTSSQWQDRTTGEVVREKTRVVLVVAPAGAQTDNAVQTIRDTYKAQFRQQSVMLSDHIDCVDF
ncbi:MAG: DUF3574 domain-containing protein [Actinomycetes bacterium]